MGTNLRVDFSDCSGMSPALENTSKPHLILPWCRTFSLAITCVVHVDRAADGIPPFTSTSKSSLLIFPWAPRETKQAEGKNEGEGR